MSYDIVGEKALSSFYNKKNAPQHLAKRTATKYGAMPLFELKDKGMWNSRIEKIVPYIPNGAWIAGGFLRSMIAGESDDLGDIDFFFNTEESFNKLYSLIKRPSSVRGAEKVFGHYVVSDTPADKLRIVDCESEIQFRPNIQLVRLYWFDSPEHVIDSFDFTACQFITDGKTLYFGPKSFEDVKSRIIRFHRETGGDAIATLNRIIKYQHKGYKIDKDLFERAEKDALYMLNSSDAMAKHFQQEKTESDFHKRSSSVYQRAWDYMESSPLTRSAALKAKKTKLPVDKSRRTSYQYGGS